MVTLLFNSITISLQTALVLNEYDYITRNIRTYIANKIDFAEVSNINLNKIV